MNTRFTRRSWLRSTAVLPLTTPFIGFGEEVKPATSLPIGFGTYGLPDYSVADAINLVAEVGFDSIELAAMPGYHAAPDQLSKARRDEIRQLLSDKNLKLGALMGFPTPNPDKQEENNTWFDQLLELATDLSPDDHPPIIQSVLGGGKWDDKKTIFRDALGQWVEKAAQAGVTLAIKPHRSHAMDLPEQAAWLIKQLNAGETLKMVYDQSHFAFRDLPIEETIATALPYTGYIVLKDAVRRDGRVRFALPGETAALPHAKVLKQFIEGGYKGEVCAEVSSQVWKAEGYKPAAAAESCYTNLSRIVSQARETGFTTIFNGHDFSDWDGEPGAWEVRDGEIWCTGISKGKNWLIWRKDQPANFTLRLEFRWDKGNSGVQVRSDDLGDWQIFGYQVEVAAQEKMGLWHHSLLSKEHPKKKERHLMATAGQEVTIAEDGSKTLSQVNPPTDIQSHFREHDWNDMEIIANGPRLIQKINGITFAEITDHDREMSRKKGYIALQDHGKGCKVAFRNIRIRPLE